MKTKILILCTGNTCRSQMAEGFLKSFDKELDVYSAGIKHAEKVNPNAVKVMNELGIDISGGIPNDVKEFLNDSFDYVITVCDNAKEACPIFSGNVKEQLHIGFEDPSDVIGSEQEVLAVFRKIRDEIRRDFYKFYVERINKIDNVT
ncbi:MAG: arsenate reductase ArsC [Bacteroidetes bacterium]|nr:arsenate reductase ArsC [Bacteroidota bacterium]